MNLNAIPKMIKNFCGDGLIDVTPVDGFGCRGLIDNKTILWRATCARSSFNDNGAIAGKFSFAPGDCLLGKARTGEIDQGVLVIVFLLLKSNFLTAAIMPEKAV